MPAAHVPAGAAGILWFFRRPPPLAQSRSHTCLCPCSLRRWTQSLWGGTPPSRAITTSGRPISARRRRPLARHSLIFRLFCSTSGASACGRSFKSSPKSPTTALSRHSDGKSKTGRPYVSLKVFTFNSFFSSTASSTASHPAKAQRAYWNATGSNDTSTLYSDFIRLCTTSNCRGPTAASTGTPPPASSPRSLSCCTAPSAMSWFSPLLKFFA